MTAMFILQIGAGVKQFRSPLIYRNLLFYVAPKLKILFVIYEHTIDDAKIQNTVIHGLSLLNTYVYVLS